MNRTTNPPLTIAPAQNGQADPAPVAEPAALLIGLDELARMMGLSRDTVSRMGQTGRLGPRRIVLGRAVRFREPECRDWILAGCPPRDEWSWKPSGGY